MNECDLLIVMGTALAVSPFNQIVRIVGADKPKVLFNMDNTKETGGFDFCDGNDRKLFVQGKCDEKIFQLVKDCGWEEDFL